MLLQVAQLPSSNKGQVQFNLTRLSKSPEILSPGFFCDYRKV